MSARRWPPWLCALAGSLAVRATQLHSGLLYPDGYQYLLTARGIAEHGRPVTRLGPGGDLFVPTPDAAAKPLFPLLVAIGHLAGLGLREAANGVTVAAAGAVPVLCAAIVLRLSRSRAGAAVAFGAALGSPAAGYWWGYTGPDALAAALALGAALALVSGRTVLAGALAGAAVATRPELAVLVLAAVAGGLANSKTRAQAIVGLSACLSALAVVWIAVRPPASVPPERLLVAGAAAGLAVPLVTRLSPRLVAALAAAALAIVLAGEPAGGTWLRGDWPLAAIAAAGLALLLARNEHARACAAIASGALALAVVYHLKNPSSDRYLAELVPFLALAAGLGGASAARLRVRARVLAVAAGAASLAALPFLPLRSSPGDDAFAALAPKLTDDPALPLVTAAPDAYGYLLPRRTVREMRAGARGIVLLDAAQREYAPDLTARGNVVATFDQALFVRPDGSLDRRNLALVRGVVVRRSTS